MCCYIRSFALHICDIDFSQHRQYIILPPSTHTQGSDVFSTSTDGRVLWWDIRKLGEPVETLPLEFAGYKPGETLGGITLEYESTMV